MTIALASDHAGVDLKDALVAWLKDEGYTVLDLGTNGHDSVDYPDYGARLARTIAAGEAEGAAQGGLRYGWQSRKGHGNDSLCRKVTDRTLRVNGTSTNFL